jgi:predicted dehydrogenase
VTTVELTLALIGCGGMGRRHILGMKKLLAIGQMPFRLVAVCDPFTENASKAAELAADMLGYRPQVFQSFAAARRAIPSLDAVDLTTSPDFHATLGMEALQAGVHVMVEKPITLMLAEGVRLVRTAAETGRKLAVAENYRRDPINRLARALVDAGALGRPFLAVQSSSGSADQVIITPWRHLKQTGGIAVDMGVHYADLLEYYLGPVASLTGMSSVVHTQRVDQEGIGHPADAEDLCVGVLRHENGALANWMFSVAGRGQDHFIRTLYGTEGALAIPRDRTGSPLALEVRDGARTVTLPASELLRLAPGYLLDNVTAALFGGERLTSYQMAFADVDANLLAIELADFAEAIAGDRQPEVDGMGGLRALAVSYGLIESDRLGRSVNMAELLSGKPMPYQQEIAGLSGGRNG